jgi:molybdopterin converting factor subunit 1
MAITVLFFGQLAELAGTRSLSLNDVSDTGELTARMLQKFPDLAKVNFNVAVDTEIIQENTLLKGGNTVALLPPFSGG